MQASNPEKQHKRIYQLLLKFPTGFPPYHRLNPYVLLSELNKHAKEKFDIEFLSIKYYMTNNRQQRNMNERPIGHAQESQFKIDSTYNNIFTCAGAQFLKNNIFSQAEKLKAPKDYNPEQSQKALQNQLKSQQLERLKEIKQKIQGIAGFVNEEQKYKDERSIRSIDSFKMCFNSQYFKQNQFQVYAKVLMHPPLFQKLKQKRNDRDGFTEVFFKYKDTIIRVFLNAFKSESLFESASTEYRMNNWSLGAFHEDFIDYFGTDDLMKKMSKINPLKIISSISFQQHNSSINSFSLLTFLWNETVLKVTIKIAQIRKIEIGTKDKQKQYYFHLEFPPAFYINRLKIDQACSQKFWKFPDRVTNFLFLDTKLIRNNHFLRYFLFNNSILRISLTLDDELQGGSYMPVSQTHKKLQHFCQSYKGPIQIVHRTEGLYRIKRTLKTLNQEMSYTALKNVRTQQLLKQDQDRMWLIRYLILVLVRRNFIIPSEHDIGKVIQIIQNNKSRGDLDCYLYVLWKAATNMERNHFQGLKFYEFFEKQCEEVKKMNIKNQMSQILNSETIIYVLRVSLTPSGILHNPPAPEMKGRLLKQYDNYWQFFIRASIAEESEIELKNQKYITRMYLRQRMKEVQIFDRLYDPLGWSSSQLRSFSMWYFHRVQGREYDNFKLDMLDRRKILEFLGDFSKIQNPAKKAARIGQSFSSSWTYSDKKNPILKWSMIKDKYSNKDLMYTDGIGKISKNLLQKISISNSLNIRDLTVIQVRYLGAKGLLVLDPDLHQKDIILRESMVKFPCENKQAQKYLDILDWNKYKSGYLNRQVIILLRTLGIEDITFITVQEEHIKNIQNMTFKDCSIFKNLQTDLNTDINNLEPANETILNLLQAGFELEKQPFFRGVLQTLKNNGYYQLKAKSSIMIEKSARIIGIIDQDEILEEDEVYCSIYNSLAREPLKEVIEGKAIITRNPCLHPADIRIVVCVGKKQIAERYEKLGKSNKLEKLQNVVIMPMKGPYPLTSQISGSDLDGDNFFICWDDRLIPQQAQPPYILDQIGVVKKKQSQPTQFPSEQKTYEKMLDFFIDYTNYEKLGQIDNAHLVHADQDLLNYANNKICLRLAQIHGKAVDFPKTGYCPPVDSTLFVSCYPDFMQKQNNEMYQSQSILGKLYRGIKDKINTLLENQVQINVTQIDHQILNDYKFDQSLEEVKKCITILRQYERQMTHLKNMLGVDYEYQIYTGNFSAVKNKVKVYGKNRLVSTIINLRHRFFQLFFQDLNDQDKELYRKTGIEQLHMKKPKYFSAQTLRQAQLFYLINYTLKFPQIKFQKQGVNELKQKIRKVIEEMKIMNPDLIYCGFVWFVIPKVILNLKISHDANKKEEQQDEQGGEDSDQYI